MTSGTLKGAYHLAAVGLALVVGLLSLEHFEARPETIREYVGLCEVLVAALAAALGVYGSRNLPLSGRAPTSAEMSRPEPRRPMMPREDTDHG